MDVKDAQKQLVDPALKGTRNVLNAVNKSNTVKRVVLTSSVVSIYGDAQDMSGKTPFTEEDWNTTSRLDHQPYSYSKVLAEKEAWKICKAQDKWDLVTINPGFVLGPSLTKYSGSESIKMMTDFLKGKLRFGIPALHFGYVDVRDVAKAHILVASKASAQGRHITVVGDAPMMKMPDVLRKKYGKKFKLPKTIAPKWLLMLVGPSQGLTREYIKKNVGYKLHFDNSKLKEKHAFQYRDLDQTIVDHAEQLIELGVV